VPETLFYYMLLPIIRKADLALARFVRCYRGIRRRHLPSGRRPTPRHTTLHYFNPPLTRRSLIDGEDFGGQLLAGQTSPPENIKEKNINNRFAERLIQKNVIIHFNEKTVSRDNEVNEMDAIRQIVDGSALAPLIRLPKSFHGKKVEVIVFPAEKDESADKGLPRITRAQLDELKRTSKVSALRGSIPHPAVTIQEIREERLRERYGRTD
jgi:hypothetical protein